MHYWGVERKIKDLEDEVFEKERKLEFTITENQNLISTLIQKINEINNKAIGG